MKKFGQTCSWWVWTGITLCRRDTGSGTSNTPFLLQNLLLQNHKPVILYHDNITLKHTMWPFRWNVRTKTINYYTHVVTLPTTLRQVLLLWGRVHTVNQKFPFWLGNFISRNLFQNHTRACRQRWMAKGVNCCFFVSIAKNRKQRTDVSGADWLSSDARPTAGTPASLKRTLRVLLLKVGRLVLQLLGAAPAIWPRGGRQPLHHFLAGWPPASYLLSLPQFFHLQNGE